MCMLLTGQAVLVSFEGRWAAALGQRYFCRQVCIWKHCAVSSRDDLLQFQYGPEGFPGYHAERMLRPRLVQEVTPWDPEVNTL
jgi:hypothetical protein